MQTQYTQTTLAKLVEDVEKAFSAELAKAEGEEITLAKAEDEKKPKPEDMKPEAEAKPEGESKPQAEAKPESEVPPKAEAKPEGEVPPQEGAPAPQEGAAPQGDESCDYDEEDMAHMRKMYSSMSKGELKAHHDVIAELAKCGSAAPAPTAGMAKGERASELKDENKLSPKPSVKGDNLDSDPKNGGIEGQEPNNSPGAKSPASDANGDKINKSEAARRNGGKIEGQEPNNSPGAKSPASDANGAKMNKSEGNTEVELVKAELETTKTELETMKKQFEGVTAFLTKFVEKTAPAQKAITSLEVIAKSEGNGEEKTLSKSEIDSILNKKASDPTLKKSDRDAINTYYLSDKDIKGISHLLK